jgi:predicted nucleic acid-binding protein
MKLLFDTCVLYPTVMRAALMGACQVMGWTPLWSDRILEEWARSARKLGPMGEDQARAEIALLQADWPNARVSYSSGLEARLYLPDPADRHVLAAAIAGNADKIVTLNNKDFPKQTLWDEGVDRIDPDRLMFEAVQSRPDAMHRIAADILADANRMSDAEWTMRALFKKARLPKFAKAISN